jgi:acyl dehydratase
MSSNQIPSVGDLGPVVSFGPISRTDIVRYVGASGDFNPIHHDEEFAQTAGFPTVFSVGMLQAGLLATYATDWLGARNLRRYVMRFKEQVWPGDELTCICPSVKCFLTTDNALHGTRQRKSFCHRQSCRRTGASPATGSSSPNQRSLFRRSQRL